MNKIKIIYDKLINNWIEQNYLVNNDTDEERVFIDSLLEFITYLDKLYETENNRSN